MATKSITKHSHYNHSTTVGDVQKKLGVSLNAPAQMPLSDYLKKKGMPALAKLISRGKK